MTVTLLILASLFVSRSNLSSASSEAVLTEDFSQLTPYNARPFRYVRIVLVPDSLTDDEAGYYQVEAAGPGQHLRIVAFAKGEPDEGLDRALPIVVEGYLVLIRHRASWGFPALDELQLKEARRVR